MYRENNVAPAEPGRRLTGGTIEPVSGLSSDTFQMPLQIGQSLSQSSSDSGGLSTAAIVCMSIFIPIGAGLLVFVAYKYGFFRAERRYAKMKELDSGGDLELAGVAVGTTASIETGEGGAAIGQKVDFKSNEISPTKDTGGTMTSTLNMTGSGVVGSEGGVVMAAPNTPITQEEYVDPNTPTGMGTIGAVALFEGNPEDFDIGSSGGEDVDSFHDADDQPSDVSAPPPPPPPDMPPPVLPPMTTASNEEMLEGRPRVNTVDLDDVAKAEDLL